MSVEVTRRQVLLAAGALSTLAASDAAGATAGNSLKQKLDQYVRSFAQSGLFSGTVYVERQGEPVLSASYGTAERAFGAPMRFDTRLQIASLSKPITSAAIGRLVDQGKLGYETMIGSLVTGIPNGEKISIELLLTHHSGLDSPDRLAGSGDWMRNRQSTEMLVDRIRQTTPHFEPGARYEYSNANYWLLAHVIEKLSGTDYGTFLAREIFTPLGMKDTGHRGDLLAVVPRLAPGYQLDGPDRWRIAELIDWTSKTGNGSLYSTAADLARFYRAMTQAKLLSPQTTARVLGTGKDFGFGWFHRTAEKYGKPSIFFNGRSPGYSSYLEGFLDDGIFFLILSNLYVYAPTAMAEGIGAILWDKPYKLQEPIALVPVTASALSAFEGTYQFGSDFFLRDGSARVFADTDHLKMAWSAGGLTTVLLPVGPNRFFDPTFWATIDFTGAGLRYQAYGFTRIFEAPRSASP